MAFKLGQPYLKQPTRAFQGVTDSNSFSGSIFVDPHLPYLHSFQRFTSLRKRGLFSTFSLTVEQNSRYYFQNTVFWKQKPLNRIQILPQCWWFQFLLSTRLKEHSRFLTIYFSMYLKEMALPLSTLFPSICVTRIFTISAEIEKEYNWYCTMAILTKIIVTYTDME